MSFWVKRDNGSRKSFPIERPWTKGALPVQQTRFFASYLLAQRAKKTKSGGCESTRATLLKKNGRSIRFCP
jgi:hypothetical protein